MSNLLEIMDKKSCGKSEIYISEEDGRWYACYRSAHLLKKLNETVLRGVMLDKVEVDLNKLLNGPWIVVLCSDNEIIMMLERELSNDGLIYIYRESDGKWYAYEQSAFYLSRMMLELSLDRYVMENALWLARAEIDVNRIPWDKVISHSQSEYVLHYTPYDGFHEWLVEIK